MEQVSIANSPSPQLQHSRKYRWLRHYVLLGLPTLLLLSLVVTYWAGRQARQATTRLLAQEMISMEQVDDESLLAERIQTSTSYLSERSLFYTSEWVLPADATTVPLEGLSRGTLHERGNWILGDYDLIYQRRFPATNNTLVALVGNDAVRSAALSWLLPILGALIVTFSTFAALIYAWQQRRAQLFEKLKYATIDVANGQFDTSIELGGASELGELGELFDRMRRALKLRIDDAQLVLEISEGVARTINLDEGMPIILEGILRGTSADGARAIVVNPSGGRPLLFGAGEAAGGMTALDRRLLLQMRNSQDEFMLRSEAEIRPKLDLPPTRKLTIKSLIAFPLFTQEKRLQGVLWLGYRDELKTRPPEYHLMKSVVNRASSLVANSRLFAIAEQGRRRMAAVLLSTSDAVAVTDHTDRFLFLNPAMESAFGLRIADVVGRQVKDVVSNAGLCEVLIGNILKVHGGEISSENEKTYYASVAKVKGQDGSIMGRVVVLHDITRLKQIDVMKSEFVASVSHDLRNPLAYMHTYASLLPELGELTSAQEEYVNHILHGIGRMHTTIGELLDLNRIESEVDTLEIVKIDVQEFLETLANEHSPHANSIGNRLVVTPLDERLFVPADVWSLRLALNNLIGNSLTYAPHTGDITLSARATSESIIMSIQDNGPGISKADQARIFEKFYRASEPATPDADGSGLGLAIVKSIALRHGGRVWCDSDLGKGCTFSISFPIEIRTTALSFDF